MFCKNRCSYKFCNIHWRTPVLESRFNKVADLKARNFIKKRLQHSCFSVNTAHKMFWRKAVLKNFSNKSPKKINDQYGVLEIFFNIFVPLGSKYTCDVDGIFHFSLLYSFHLLFPRNKICWWGIENTLLLWNHILVPQVV